MSNNKCFVDIRLSKKEDVISKLNTKLFIYESRGVFTKIDKSKTYLELVNGTGQNSFEFLVNKYLNIYDWKGAGLEAIKRDYPEILSNQGEPELFFNKNGTPYIKLGKGVIHSFTGGTNVKTDQLTEFKKTIAVKILNALEIGRDDFSMKSYIKSVMKRNADYFAEILVESKKEEDVLFEELYDEDGDLIDESKIKLDRFFYLIEKNKDIRQKMNFLNIALTSRDMTLSILRDVKSIVTDSEGEYIEDVDDKEESGESATELHGKSKDRVSDKLSLSPTIKMVLSSVPKKIEEFTDPSDKKTNRAFAASLLPLEPIYEDFKTVFDKVQVLINNKFRNKAKQFVIDDAVIDLEDFDSLTDEQKEDLDEFLRKDSSYEIMIQTLKDESVDKDGYENAEVSGFVTRLEQEIEKQTSERDKQAIKTQFVTSFQKGRSENTYYITSSENRLYDKKDYTNVLRSSPSLESEKKQKAIDNFIDIYISAARLSGKSKKEVTEILEKESKIRFLSDRIKFLNTREFKEKFIEKAILKASGQATNMRPQEIFVYNQMDVAELKSKKEEYAINFVNKYRNETISNLKKEVHKYFVDAYNIKLSKRSVDYITRVHAYDVIEDLNKINSSKLFAKSKKIEGTWELANEYYKPENEAIKQEIRGLFENSIGYIAGLEAVDNKSMSEATTVSGGEKRWMYSYLSKMHNDLVRWKEGDLSDLEQLENTGNEFVDYMLGYEYEADSIGESQKDVAVFRDGKKKKSAKLSKERIDRLIIRNNIHVSRKNSGDDVSFDVLTKEDMMLIMYTNMMEPMKEIYNNIAFQDKRPEAVDRRKNKNYFSDYVNLRNVDKSKTESIGNIPMGGSNAVVDSNTGLVKSIGAENINRVNNKINGEYHKIEQEYKLINKYLGLSGEEKRKFAREKLIPGWHYKVILEVTRNDGSVAYEARTKKYNLTDSDFEVTEDMFLNGNFRNFGFFQEIYEANKSVIDTYIDANLTGKPKGVSEKPNIDESIDEVVKKILNQEVKTLMSMEKVFEEETNVLKISEEGQKLTESKIAADFAMNYLITTIDTFNLFHGELGLYKQPELGMFNMQEPFKRTSAPNADGKYPDMINPTEVAFYVSFEGKQSGVNASDSESKVEFLRSEKTVFAMVQEQSYTKSSYGDIINSVLEAEYESSERDGSYNKSLLAGDVADGQSFGDPDYVMYLMDSIYGITEEDMKLHEQLKNPDTVITNKHIKFLKKMYGAQHSKKLQSFSVEKLNGVTRMPFMWKSSIFPTYASITKGLPINNLAVAMKEQGVDVIAMSSAVKNVTLQATRIHEEEPSFKEEGGIGSIISSKNIRLNPFLISTDSIKMQVELAFKEDKTGLVGSQPLRNIQVNVDLNSDEKKYRFRDKNYTGVEMNKIFNEAVSDVIKGQLGSFLAKIKYKESNNGEFDLSGIRKMIAEQIDDLDEDSLNMLLSNDFPIESIPGISKAIYPVFSKHITKKVAKASTNSVALIQTANFGFNTKDASKSNIAFVDKNIELKPPRPYSFADAKKDEKYSEIISSLQEEVDALISKGKYKSEEDVPVYFNRNDSIKEGDNLFSVTKKPGFFADIKKAQILMPFSSLVFDSNVSWEEFKGLLKAGKIDKKILTTIVGYRTPNQSMASNDSFEIVGFIPPQMGNTAVLYHEITAKTGSDFDIDKLTLMIPNVNKKYALLDEKLNKEHLDLTNQALGMFKINDFFDENDDITFHDMLGLLYNSDEFESLISNKFKGKKITDDFILKEIYINKDAIFSALDKDTRVFEVFRESRPSSYTLYELFEELTDAIKLRNNAIDDFLVNNGANKRRYYSIESIEYVNDDSKYGAQNKLIEATQAILSSQSSFDDLISPLDNPLVKNSINKQLYEYSIVNNPNLKVEEKKSEIKSFRKLDDKAQDKLIKSYKDDIMPSLLSSNMPSHLAKTRLEMIIAKGLTATMANQMVNLPLAQLNEAFLKYDLMLENLTEDFSRSHVVGQESDDSMKISKLINYLMNASVDAAKDNYIVEGNLNGYTSNAAMVLFRLGMASEDVFKILLHPSIIKLTKNKASSTSKLLEIENLYSQEKLDLMSTEFVKMLHNNIASKTPVKLNGDYFLDSAMKLASAKTHKIDTTNLERDAIGFWNIIMTIGKDLSSTIGISNPDSKQFGVTFEDAFAKENGLILNKLSSFVAKDYEGNNISNAITYDREITSIPAFINESSSVHEEEEYRNYIGSTLNVNASLLHELLGSVMIETSPEYKKLLNLMLMNTGKTYSMSSDHIRSVNKSLYSYVLASSGHEAVNFSSEEAEYLLNSFYKDVLELKNHPDLIGNKFLLSLDVNSFEKTVNFDNLSNYSTQDSIAIKEDFKDILNLKTNSSGREDRDFGYNIVEKFVQYSFLTTGFNNSGKSYLNKVPSNYYRMSGYGASIKEVIKNLNTPGSDFAADNLDKALLFMAITNPGNSFIYKKLRKDVDVSIDFNNAQPSISNSYSYTDKITGEKRLSPFVTYYNPKLRMSKNYALVNEYDSKGSSRQVYVELKTNTYAKTGKKAKDSDLFKTGNKEFSRPNAIKDIKTYDLNRANLFSLILNKKEGKSYSLSAGRLMPNLEEIKEKKLFGLNYSKTYSNKDKKRRLIHTRVSQKDSVVFSSEVKNINFLDRNQAANDVVDALEKFGAINTSMDVVNSNKLEEAKKILINYSGSLFGPDFFAKSGSPFYADNNQEMPRIKFNSLFFEEMQLAQEEENLRYEKSEAAVNQDIITEDSDDGIETDEYDDLIKEMIASGEIIFKDSENNPCNLTGITKPSYKLALKSKNDLLNTNDPVKNKIIQDGLKARIDKLNEISGKIWKE